ncbi:hypothetical protein EUX98_g7315 [Antrodiella citrinella]|uniref:Uncharacterized protein n=1 Tax=Antrodiella citrinella TaxID=2447956 RepID=A0A4S4MM45_9APHY|nr:hypothetical protein EUX98_g7315 [Antrodiella citrinella]
MVTAIIYYITYGKRISGMNDPEAVTPVARIALEGISIVLIPGISWLEYFPLTRHITSWVPGTATKKLAEKYALYVRKVRDEPYDETKAALEKGTATPSLAASLIEQNHEMYGETEEEKIYDEIARNVAAERLGLTSLHVPVHVRPSWHWN